MSAPGSTLPPEQQAAMAKLERDGRAGTMWTIAMIGIYGWDYLMCFPREIKYVWRKQFSYMSALYAVNRYFGILMGAIIIWILEISDTGRADTCRRIYRWEPVSAMISILLSQTIMASRVYALYGMSKIILAVLANIMAVEFAVHTYVLTLVTPATGPPGVVLPCVAIAPFGWLIGFWAIPLLFDTVTFVLTCLKTFMFWKREIHTPTLTLIFRDGLVYFAVIFSMNLVNVVLFVTQDNGIQAINLPATTLLNVIMSCRLVLNLRKPRAKVHMSAVAPSLTKERERQGELWDSSTRSQNNVYELSPSSTTVPSAAVAVTTKTDTFV